MTRNGQLDGIAIEVSGDSRCINAWLGISKPYSSIQLQRTCSRRLQPDGPLWLSIFTQCADSLAVRTCRHVLFQQRPSSCSSADVSALSRMGIVESSLRGEGGVCEGRGGSDCSREGGILPHQRILIAAPTSPSKVKQAPHPSPVLEIL